MSAGSPVWHPFTQHALQPHAIDIARAGGAWLERRDGSRLVDAISSWWVVTHGHCHAKIMAAIRAQTERLDQVIFAGFTHEPAEKVAHGLLKLANGEGVASHAQPQQRPAGSADLSHVFFSDSGSTSVEVALKMALGYWRNRGEPRTRILAFEHAYHGDTIGTMSAGARGVFNAPYEPLLFDVARVPFPRPRFEHLTLDALESEARRGDAAALIVEPLVLGAGGMLVYDAALLTQMKAICERYRVLFIADEVMTGWGRTGTFLACEQAGITPDIVCLAKGITGGALPLAATLCRREIFEAHYSTDRAKTFFHSSSYTANPICCAAALANIEIWEDEPVLDRIGALARMQAERLARLASAGNVVNPRQIGTIAAFDVAVRDTGYLAGIGPKLYGSFIERGVLLRPLGNTIYVMPPYCISADELDLVYASIAGVVAGTH